MADKKNGRDKPTCRASIETVLEKRPWTRVRAELGGWRWQVYATTCNAGGWWGAAVQHRGLSSGLHDDLGGGRPPREGMYAHRALIPFLESTNQHNLIKQLYADCFKELFGILHCLSLPYSLSLYTHTYTHTTQCPGSQLQLRIIPSNSLTQMPPTINPRRHPTNNLMTPLVQLIQKHEADRPFLGNPFLFQLSAPNSFLSFSNSRSFTVLSCVRFFRDSVSVGFPRREYWSGLPFPTPGDLPDPGVEPAPPASSAQTADSLAQAPPGKPGCSWAFRSFIVVPEDPTTMGPCSLVWDPPASSTSRSPPQSPRLPSAWLTV